jgi:hypothetical protein
MRVERDWLRQLVFEIDDARRFTQDSPILPEVWLRGGLEYCRDPRVRVDLLLTPHKRQTAGGLARAVLERLNAAFGENPADREAPVRPLLRGPDDPLAWRSTWTLSVNQTTVAASLTLDELIVCVLPLSQWWIRNLVGRDGPSASRPAAELRRPPNLDAARRAADLRWMSRIVGVIHRCARTPAPEAPIAARLDPGALWVSSQSDRQLTGATVGEHEQFRAFAADAAENEAIFRSLVDRAREVAPEPGAPGEAMRAPDLWTVGLNRRAAVAIDRSVAATKADAARRVFEIDCSDLAWAVLDSGIDAAHPALQGPRDPSTGQTSRVRATYDFTKLRQLLSLDSHPTTGPAAVAKDVDLEEADRQFKRMRMRLRSGRSLDWGSLEPLIDITMGRSPAYRPPVHDHGTHVAGILAARPSEGSPLAGLCPDIRLYDLRVLDDQGRGDEFSIIAALQFIRYLNARADQPVIHGVNLSLSLIHDVENFACGRTPVCDECERLVASGVVVVAAAGNRGYERVLTSAGELDAFRAISITDPGNAEAVITVGATHRFQPHTYGVSYFSSRGPTGDGRVKPDILGPGERISSTLPGGGYGAKDGTSMAAPHVSGVAALLMARHREFLNQPARVKKILCDTATDLGRERYFQGCGMVDALRALQSV